MKQLLIGLACAACLQAQAQIAVYKYAERGTVTGNPKSHTVTYGGYIIWDLVTGDIGAVKSVPLSKKYYSSVLDLLYVWNAAQFTVFEAAVNDSDSDGNATVFTSFAKGIAASVDVGDPQYNWLIPKSFKITGRSLDWYNGETQFEETTGSLVIDLADSQWCTMLGYDLSDAMGYMETVLQDKGYVSGN